MIATARVCAGLAALFAMLALFGYAVDLPLLIYIRRGLRGMAPLTATALLELALSIFAFTFGRRPLSLLGALAGAAAGAVALTAHAVSGSDTVNPWIGRMAFQTPPAEIGRTSVATALCVLLVAVSIITRRRNTRASDLTAGAALLISGMALLGYLYGVRDLYALPMFNSIALNTCAALFLVSVAALLIEPKQGWASLLGSEQIGGAATRRQLAFCVFPILAGWVLVRATEAARVGPAVAMALLVIVTVVPLALIVLRDGRILVALDKARQEKIELQNRLTCEMAEQLSDQAKELARESEERAKAEAVLHHAQRMEAVGQLTGGVAHDFNNLLTAIQGNLELLKRRLPAGEERLHCYLANASAATEKGAKVTSQLLAFSRSQRLDIRPVELDPVLLSARELIGTALGPGITLSTQLNTLGIWVTTDPDQLELAILNLAVNARDAMPQGGKIWIESSCDEALFDEFKTKSFVAVRVIDDGTGMPPEVVTRAAEPFFTTKDRGKGTGLGLAQVYGFARQCGGDLRITSALGAGTTVEILLPLSKPVHSSAQVTTVVSPDVDRGQLKEILVIDDDDAVRAVITDALSASGFQVIEASDGESGLALLDQSEPLVALIDFLMPGMNGAEVARIAQQRRPGLPILFISGYSDTLALDGISGAIVLRKPFDIAGLDKAVNSLLY